LRWLGAPRSDDGNEVDTEVNHFGELRQQTKLAFGRANLKADALAFYPAENPSIGQTEPATMMPT
jgi:hypothetical protein